MVLCRLCSRERSSKRRRTTSAASTWLGSWVWAPSGSALPRRSSSSRRQAPSPEERDRSRRTPCLELQVRSKRSAKRRPYGRHVGERAPQRARGAVTSRNPNEPRVPTVDRRTDKVRRDVTRAKRGGGNGDWRREPLHRAGAGGRSESQAHRAQQRVRRLRPARSPDRRRSPGRPERRQEDRAGPSSVDQFLTHNLQVVEASGTPVLTLTVPPKCSSPGWSWRTPPVDRWVRSFRRTWLAGSASAFRPEVAGSAPSTPRTGGRWNFNIQDESGAEVTGITKTWEGLAKTAFTSADNYVIQIHRPSRSRCAAWCCRHRPQAGRRRLQLTSEPTRCSRVPTPRRHSDDQESPQRHEVFSTRRPDSPPRHRPSGSACKTATTTRFGSPPWPSASAKTSSA